MLVIKQLSALIDFHSREGNIMEVSGGHQLFDFVLT